MPKSKRNKLGPVLRSTQSISLMRVGTTVSDRDLQVLGDAQ